MLLFLRFAQLLAAGFMFIQGILAAICKTGAWKGRYRKKRTRALAQLYMVFIICRQNWKFCRLKTPARLLKIQIIFNYKTKEVLIEIVKSSYPLNNLCVQKSTHRRPRVSEQSLNLPSPDLERTVVQFRTWVLKRGWYPKSPNSRSERTLVHILIWYPVLARFLHDRMLSFKSGRISWRPSVFLGVVSRSGVALQSVQYGCPELDMC